MLITAHPVFIRCLSFSYLFVYNIILSYKTITTELSRKWNTKRIRKWNYSQSKRTSQTKAYAAEKHITKAKFLHTVKPAQ